MFLASNNSTSLHQICFYAKETKLGGIKGESRTGSPSTLWNSVSFKPRLWITTAKTLLPACHTCWHHQVFRLQNASRNVQQIDTSLQTGSSVNPFSGYDKLLLYCFDRKFSSGIICIRIWLRQHQSQIWPACLVLFRNLILSVFKDKCILSVTRPSVEG